MRLFHSIHWRLQLWLGLLLALVLSGFALTMWQLQRDTALQRVDQDLADAAPVVMDALHRGGRPLRDGWPPPGAPRPGGRGTDSPNPGRLDQAPAFLPGALGGKIYYIAWLSDGSEAFRSADAPAGLACPEPSDRPRQARLRGIYREVCLFTPPGGCILVGRDIREVLADSRRFAWILAAVGGLVLALGLAGSRWISVRALRPIGEISATAARIAAGDLAQRIPVASTRSELGNLARVLNETFDRLQASFARQAQFTADASHELRTPVSVVLTQTQSALARERSAAEYRDSLAACQRAAQRMRRLTESLMMLARLDAGDAATGHEACDLEGIVQEAAELLRPLAEAQNIELAIESQPTCCKGNSEQLGQAAANLISNAIYYNRPGGHVKVRLLAEPGQVVLTVTDSGVGIAVEDLPHIFERFYRADRSRSGTAGRTGLGLAITKAIVAAHGGAIAAVSEPGSGSTFTVRLPK